MWTQTYFALRARPDARLRRAATLIYDSALITACRAGALSRLRLGGTLALTLHVTPRPARSSRFRPCPAPIPMHLPPTRQSSLTVIDPGIPGYLAAGKSTYQNGSMATGDGHKPVHLLPVGAEQVVHPAPVAIEPVVHLLPVTLPTCCLASPSPGISRAELSRCPRTTTAASTRWS